MPAASKIRSGAQHFLHLVLHGQEVFEVQGGMRADGDAARFLVCHHLGAELLPLLGVLLEAPEAGSTQLSAFCVLPPLGFRLDAVGASNHGQWVFGLRLRIVFPVSFQGMRDEASGHGAVGAEGIGFSLLHPITTGRAIFMAFS